MNACLDRLMGVFLYRLMRQLNEGVSTHVACLDRLIRVCLDKLMRHCLYRLMWAADSMACPLLNRSLQKTDLTHVVSACEFLSDVVFQDFPAEVFLQRPSIVKVRTDPAYITRYIGHSGLTLFSLQVGHSLLKCIDHQSPLTRKHIRLNCLHFMALCKQFYNANMMHNLLSKVKQEAILAFLRAAGRFQL